MLHLRRAQVQRRRDAEVVSTLDSGVVSTLDSGVVQTLGTRSLKHSQGRQKDIWSTASELQSPVSQLPSQTWTFRLRVLIALSWTLMTRLRCVVSPSPHARAAV